MELPLKAAWTGEAGSKRKRVAKAAVKSKKRSWATIHIKYNVLSNKY